MSDVATEEETEATVDEANVCGRMINEDKEIFCGREAVTDIIVSNIFGKFLVPLCKDCDTKHREFYSNRRRARPHGKRKRGRVFPRNGEPGAGHR